MIGPPHYSRPATPGRAAFSASLVRRYGIEVIAVVDTGSKRAAKSVTNDAENVIDELARVYTLQGRRVIYMDSEGVFDELRHDGAHFVGFAPVREKSLDRSIAKLAGA